MADRLSHTGRRSARADTSAKLSADRVMAQRVSHTEAAVGIAEARLVNQGLNWPRHRRATDVVEWFGAVQAQEYEPAKWGLGLRTHDGVDREIEGAFADGRILRTHVMRPTWHFVTAADIGWLLALT